MCSGLGWSSPDQSALGLPPTHGAWVSVAVWTMSPIVGVVGLKLIFGAVGGVGLGVPGCGVVDKPNSAGVASFPFGAPPSVDMCVFRGSLVLWTWRSLAFQCELGAGSVCCPVVDLVSWFPCGAFRLICSNSSLVVLDQDLLLFEPCALVVHQKGVPCHW